MNISWIRHTPLVNGTAVCDDSGLCETIDAAAELSDERIIWRNRRLVALVDISPVVLGHSMVCPTDHVVATKHLGKDSAHYIWQEAKDLGRQISQQLGAQSFVLLEHGVSPDHSGAGCVRHAHVHVCPLFNNVNAAFPEYAFRDVCLESETYKSFLEAVKYVDEIESYLLGNLGGEIWLAGVPRKDIRQVSRVLLAEVNNKDSTLIDWAVAAGGKLFRESLREVSSLKDNNSPILDEKLVQGLVMPLNEPGKLENIVVPTFSNEIAKQVVDLRGGLITTVLDAADQDDCAVLNVTGDVDLVWGSDYIRGPKFSLFEKGYLSLYDIGWYLAGANLSDIAAMGAVPVGLLSVIRYPKEMDDEDFRAVLEGIRDSCASCGTKNLGGDIGSAERLILSASALGAVERGRALRRSQAKPGQLLVVTGYTGLAGAAMRAGISERSEITKTKAFISALQKWKRVKPRFAHARILAQYAPHVGGCLDTSDGLLGAMGEIAKRSKVGILVDAGMVPVHPAVAEIANALDIDILSLIFGDSVDFELLFTVDQQIADELIVALRNAGLESFPIGHVEQDAGLRLIQPDGSTSAVPGVAWQH